MSTSHLVANWPWKLQETTVHRTHFKHFNMASPLMFDNFEFDSHMKMIQKPKTSTLKSVPLHSFNPIVGRWFPKFAVGCGCSIPNRMIYLNAIIEDVQLRVQLLGVMCWWCGWWFCPSLTSATGEKGFQPEHHMDSFIKYLKHDCLMKQIWEGSPVGIFDIWIGDKASVFHQYQ